MAWKFFFWESRDAIGLPALFFHCSHSFRECAEASEAGVGGQLLAGLALNISFQISFHSRRTCCRTHPSPYPNLCTRLLCYVADFFCRCITFLFIFSSVSFQLIPDSV